ncbi:sphingosine-1-phosphate phosphohydrolase-like protein [Massarina eburnea CBS 473.64]|uniref:Sphingosine-1-phosphate phosphohydrolase-like protein n=1 Tax=Massarina eburnea CBS 473.64 TaxID=1395130 RepID=A0A6A6SDK6_9PLEO|nr:sphingosine-1-phosphate phosphohydrolase-like protein [Massarina eburnea CBS 473.64]
MCSQHDDGAPERRESARLDAGNRHQDHYARRLPRWRNSLRKVLIPMVRWETPYLAYMQERLRTPTLDSYFAYTANLGTHTFYMVFLPILFWCGYTQFGRALVHMLAAGIYWSGFLKDTVCLPRPLSPPLARITMSGSAALEYGFPSSHSTNAVSVVVYLVYLLRQSPEVYNPTVYLVLQGLAYWYAISIIFGRLYCGMHGFLDVVTGSILGAVIGVLQVMYGDHLDRYIFSGGYSHPLILTLIILVLVRIHPEPADDCPCFDDSVAFTAVVIGINLGAWAYDLSGLALNDPMPSTAPFQLATIGIVKTTLRTVLGVVVIFLWRASAKPTLFKLLPPLFRLLERLRLALPRAFFLSASKYTSIPTLRDDDNVIPPVSDLPNMLKNLAHPRTRSVSVGPQSAADAYETLAYRNRRRGESFNSLEGTPKEHTWSSRQKDTESNIRPSARSAEKPLGVGLLPTPMASRVHSYEQMMGTGNPDKMTITPPESDKDFAGEAVQTPAEAENEKREIFMKLTVPRVRYDVEVVTKLIVYTGIGWLAVGGNLIFFEMVGLGMGAPS